MPRAPRNQVGTTTADRIRLGRRVEGRDRYARREAQHDYPSSHTFGAADYIDAAGRQYRLAYAPPPGGWTVGVPIPPRPANAPILRARDGSQRACLWVKLPRKRHRFGARADRDLWFDGARLATGSQAVALEPVAPGLPAVTMVVREAYRLAPTERTGRLMVTGV